jgi:hypothetical protein
MTRNRYNWEPNLLDELKSLSDRLEALERGNILEHATFTVSGDLSDPENIQTLSITDLGNKVQAKVDSFEQTAIRPDASPTPTVDGNVKSLVVSWEPITTAADVIIELHMSSDPNLQAVPGDARSFLAEVRGNIYTVRHDIDGSELIFTDGDPTDPFPDPHVYYFQTIAKTGAGAAPHSNTGSGSLRLIDSPDISANAAWFGTVSVDRLTSGLMVSESVLVGEGGVIAQGASGEEVSLRGTGFVVKGAIADGQPIYVDFPTAGGRPFLITQSLYVKSLEVEGDPITGRGLSMHGESEIAADSSLRIASAPQAPISAPQVVEEYESNTLQAPTDIPSPASNAMLAGGYYDDTLDRHYNVYDAYVVMHDAAGNYIGKIEVGSKVSGTPKGITIIGTSLYILSQGVQNKIYVTKLNSAGTVVEVAPKLIHEPPTSARLTSIAQYAGEPWVAYFEGPSTTAQLRFVKLSTTTLNVVSTTLARDTDAVNPFTWSPDFVEYITGFEVGQFDFGTGNYWFVITGTGARAYVFSNVGTRTTNREFLVEADYTFTYGDGYFRSITQVGSNWTEIVYSKDHWTSGSNVWWFATSKHDPIGPYETELGPKFYLTRTMRKGYRVTTSFEGVPAANLYVARSNTTPADSSMTYVNTIFLGESTIFSNELTSFTGTPNTPIPFPNDTPGEIVSTDGGSYWRGDNTAKFLELIVDSTTDVTAFAGNTPALRTGNIAGNHLRIDGNEIQAMSNDSTVGTFLLNTSLDAAGNPGQLQLGHGSNVFRRLKWGYDTTVSLNGSGIGNIAHGLGAVPVYAHVGSVNNGQMNVFTITNVTSTNIEVRCERADSSLVVSTTRTVEWFAIRG